MQDAFDPLGASLVELAAALRARTISAVELMELTFARLDSANPTLNAVIHQRERDLVLADVRAAQRRLDNGEARPLEGIPLGVKDLEDAAGLPTTHGSKLFVGEIAASDSTQVARLRAAGAIVVGKTNTPEFGHTVVTKNLVFGATRSPWNNEYTPGGSSGGAAAALAGGLLPLVTASDGGGSIRVPASFCGAFGFKPSHGRVPMGPSDLWDACAMSVCGPLTKTVTDAALILDQVVGPDAQDVSSLPLPGFRFVDRLKEPFAKRLRIAYSRNFGGLVPVQTDVLDVVERAIDTLRAAGHEVTIIEDGPPDLGVYWGLAFAQHLDSWLGDRVSSRREDVTSAIVKWIETARTMPPAFWGAQSRARMDVVRWFARIFADHDVLMTPTVPCDPPPAKGPIPTHIGEKPLPAGTLAGFTMPVNLAWLPAATVRAGFSKLGLPTGLQMIGPRGSDDFLLRVAQGFERSHPGHPHWPAPV